MPYISKVFCRGIGFVTYNFNVVQLTTGTANTVFTYVNTCMLEHMHRKGCYNTAAVWMPHTKASHTVNKARCCRLSYGACATQESQP